MAGDTQSIGPSAGTTDPSQMTTTAPVPSDPGIAALPPATVSALRMLATKSDRTRDIVGGLLQSIQVDPLGNKNGASLFTWPQILEQYESVLRQVNELSEHLSDPLSSSRSTNHRNPFAHTFIHASRPPLSHPPPPITPDQPPLAPEYNPHKTLLKTYAHPEYEEQKTELLNSFGKDAERTAFRPATGRKEWWSYTADEIDLLEGDDQEALYNGLREVLRGRKRKLRQAKTVLGDLKEGFDWGMRLGEEEVEEVEEEEEDEEMEEYT